MITLILLKSLVTSVFFESPLAVTLSVEALLGVVTKVAQEVVACDVVVAIVVATRFVLGRMSLH